MSANFDAFLFDLDGTLVASAGEMADALNDGLLALGLGTITQAQVERWVGGGTQALLRTVLQQVCTAPVERQPLADLAAAFNQHYARRCGSTSTLYPGVRATLEGLRAQGRKLAVLTNKDTRFTQRLLAAHGLGDRFDCVVCGDTLATKKPDPAGAQLCLQRLGVAAPRALLVGDSGTDVATARAAGLTVWALPYGYNNGRPIAESQPDRIIASCEELLN